MIDRDQEKVVRPFETPDESEETVSSPSKRLWKPWMAEVARPLAIIVPLALFFWGVFDTYHGLIGDRFDDVDRRFGEMGARIDDMGDRISDLNDAVQTTHQRIDALNADFGGRLDSAREGVQKEIRDVRREVGGLRGEIGYVKGRLDGSARETPSTP